MNYSNEVSKLSNFIFPKNNKKLPLAHIGLNIPGWPLVIFS